MKVKELYDLVNDGRIISDIELQRDIVYDDEKQVLVIDSIINGIPLPAFYLWENDKNILEVLDGKQRVEAIKRFFQNDIEYKGMLWKQTGKDLQEIICNRDLSIIKCNGPEELKREIFRRINTLGVPLSDYEVLNGLFNGEYLRGLTAYTKQDKDCIKVLPFKERGKSQYKILQLLLVLRGKEKSRENINKYVGKNQNDSFEIDQRLICKNIKFIKDVFEDYGQLDVYFMLSMKYMKDIVIWKDHKIEINRRIKRYLKSQDSRLTDKAQEIEDIIQAVVLGISVDDKRLFNSDDKIELLSQQGQIDGKYKCSRCKKDFFKEELQIDHKEAWSKGGRTVLSNAQLLCSACNRKKGFYTWIEETE